ncbi:MAG: tRNA (guanine-N1)-methyltransferase, partial [Desulfurococcales archaeon]|nr:tRNA (guanine-N1)-methyltransferase [Desulfurococcales archaeon]
SGVDKIGLLVPFEARKVSRLGFQYVAVEMLVREYSVVNRPRVGRLLFECGGHGIVGGRDGVPAGFSLVKEGGSPTLTFRDLERLLPDPPLPIFAIDLSLMPIHSKEELSSLRLQLALSLSVVREYLWDRHLLLSSAPSNTREWLWPVAGNNKMIIVKEKAGEALWRLKADRVVILRPDAQEVLSPSDVLEADAFLIGGVVDRIPRPGISRVLDTLVPWGRPRRIMLRNSIIGVPQRINRIVEILLRARYLYLGDVERAILDVMTRADKVLRLFYELQRSRVKRISLCEAMREYSWLRVDERDILLAAKKAKVEVDRSCMGNTWR